MIDIRTDFEKRFPPPADCVYNIELDHYSWISHLKSEHPFNDLWEVWQSAHAVYYAGSHDWELESAGVWESYHVCKKCGQRVRENHDDNNELPKSGCVECTGGEAVAVADDGVLNWIAGKQFNYEADLYIHPAQAGGGKAVTVDDIVAVTGTVLFSAGSQAEEVVTLQQIAEYLAENPLYPAPPTAEVNQQAREVGNE